jgi:pimeloyl-ACP methyl ester carboxylesterase
VQVSKAYLPIRESRIYYETVGEGEPVLLLHGGIGTVRDFASQTPELAKHFKVVALEQVGHGHTADNDEPFSYTIMAKYTIEFMESLGLGQANLIGWSDGGTVAILIAISRPDFVKRLVSVSGVFNTDYWATAKGLEWFRAATPDSFRRDWGKGGATAEHLKRYDEATPDGSAHWPVMFEKTKRMWLNEPNISKEDLGKVIAPTLILTGDRDAIKAEHTLELFRSIKGAQRCVIPGTSHFLLAEKPTETNRAILEFLLAGEKQTFKV